MEKEIFNYNGIKCTVICEGLKNVDKYFISIGYKLFFGEKGDFWSFEKLYNKKGIFRMYDFNGKRFKDMSSLLVYMNENSFIYNR